MSESICCCERVYASLSKEALLANIEAHARKLSIEQMKALSIFIDSWKLSKLGSTPEAALLAAKEKK